MIIVLIEIERRVRVNLGILTSNLYAKRTERPMFEGSWKNELGSILKVDQINNDGTFSGTYRTAVGDDGAQQKDEPLSGRCHGQLISFIADFYDESGSMTCWMGRHEHVQDPARGVDNEYINALWTLGRTVSGPTNEPVPQWATF